MFRVIIEFSRQDTANVERHSQKAATTQKLTLTRNGSSTTKADVDKRQLDGEQEDRCRRQRTLATTVDVDSQAKTSTDERRKTED